MLAAGANAVAAVRSPKTSAGLQELQAKYPEALTVVAMDTGVFSSVKVQSCCLASASIVKADRPGVCLCSCSCRSARHRTSCLAAAAVGC